MKRTRQEKVITVLKREERENKIEVKIVSREAHYEENKGFYGVN